MKLLSLSLTTALLAAAPLAQADDQKPSTTDTSKTGSKTGTNTGAKTGTTDKKGALAGDDLHLMAHLHHVNQMEIELAKMAAKQGTAAIKTYANMILTDHQSNDKDLMALAKRRNTTVPKFTPMTDAEKAQMKDHETQMAKLMKLKGADFDTAYLAMMISGHDGVVAQIDAGLAKTADDDLKTFLTTTRAPVQLHAQRARELQSGKPQG